MIFVAEKGGAKRSPCFTEVPSLQPPYPDVDAVIGGYGFQLPETVLQGSDWQLSDTETAKQIEVMRRSGTTLGEYVGAKIYRGVVTGFNKAFIIDGKTRDELMMADPKSAEIIKPFIVGKDIQRWRADANDRWLIYAYHGVNMGRYPALLSYLAQYRTRLESRATISSHRWYELQQPQYRYTQSFEEPKIVYPDIAKRPRFALATGGSYPDCTIFLIPEDNLFLLGLLNSTSVERFFRELGAEIRGGFLRFKTQYVSQIPIPHGEGQDRAAIEMLVGKCLALPGNPGLSELESEINERVARLYGLEVSSARTPEPVFS